jgi:hypothetical protein
MLREPNSRHFPKRSQSLKKYKPYLDNEVKILENNFPDTLKCLQ